MAINPFTLFSTKPAEEAAAARKAGLQAGFGEAQKYLTQGTERASDYYGQAAGLYDPLLGTAGQGYNQYAAATGALGPEAQRRAMAGWETSPGWQDTYNSAIEAVKRGSGGVLSGNMLSDLYSAGGSLRAGEFGRYLDRLNPFLNQYPGAIAGKGGALMGQGGLWNQLGQNLGQYGYQTQTGMGQADADAAMSKYGAAGNLLGAITGGLMLGGKALGAPIPASSIFGRMLG